MPTPLGSSTRSINPSGTPMGTPLIIASQPPTEKVAGMEIRGTPTFISWIGGKNPAGQSVQGALMSARDEKGNWIFWLQGKGANYLLKNDNGDLITNQSDATDRAREMIKWGGASDLRPLGREYVKKPSSAELNLQFQFLRYMGIPELFLQVKLGTVDGRYAVQTKTGTYWIPPGLTTDKEIRDWLRSAIAADAISNAYPLGVLTPGEQVQQQQGVAEEQVKHARQHHQRAQAGVEKVQKLCDRLKRQSALLADRRLEMEQEERPARQLAAHF